MYYGEEIGMRDVSLSRSEIMDPPGKKYWPIFKGRDGCRSPMQWNAAPFAGFSTAKPWLKVHPNYVHRNVAAQQADPNSVLNFTRRLIALRRAHAALRQGSFKPLFRTDTGVLAYERELTGLPGETERIQIYLNFSGSTRPVSFSETANPHTTTILLSSAGRAEFCPARHQFMLDPYEVLLLEVKTAAI
jgi:alpha-glucosidase